MGNKYEKHIAKRLAYENPSLVKVLYECPCNIKEKQNHHPDYLKPLEVYKLCRSCHLAEHERLRALAALSAEHISIASPLTDSLTAVNL